MELMFENPPIKQDPELYDVSIDECLEDYAQCLKHFDPKLLDMIDHLSGEGPWINTPGEGPWINTPPGTPDPELEINMPLNSMNTPPLTPTHTADIKVPNGLVFIREDCEEEALKTDVTEVVNSIMEEEETFSILADNSPFLDDGEWQKCVNFPELVFNDYLFGCKENNIYPLENELLSSPEAKYTPYSSSVSSDSSDGDPMRMVNGATCMPVTYPIMDVKTYPFMDIKTEDQPRIPTNYLTTSAPSNYFGVLADHSYHEVRQPMDLGIETPSDSVSDDDDDDDELDVVGFPPKRTKYVLQQSYQRHYKSRVVMNTKQCKGRSAVKKRSAQVLPPLKVRGLATGNPVIKNKKRGKCGRNSSMSDERREDHNSNERERRSHLKSYFSALNSLLPSQASGSKPRSKASILEGAIAQNKLLQEAEKLNLNMKRHLEAKKMRLLEKLERLQGLVKYPSQIQQWQPRRHRV